MNRRPIASVPAQPTAMSAMLRALGNLVGQNIANAKRMKFAGAALCKRAE